MRGRGNGDVSSAWPAGRRGGRSDELHCRCGRRIDRSKLPQQRVPLLLVQRSELRQESLPSWKQVYFHDALVFPPGPSLQQPKLFAPIHQRDDPMVMRLQPFGQLADARPGPPLESHDVQQQLVLEEREAMAPAQGLARAQKLPQAVPELRKALEILLGQCGRAGDSGRTRHRNARGKGGACIYIIT